MKRKGQGALEYLLLIGGAILVAVIVISILVGLGGTSGSEAELATANAQCAKYPETGADVDICEPTTGRTVNVAGITYNCCDDQFATLGRCVAQTTACTP